MVRDRPPDPGPHERLMTVRQVAARLGVGTAFVDKLCQRNELGSLRFGGALRFNESTIESFRAALERGMHKRDAAQSALCIAVASSHRPPSTRDNRDRHDGFLIAAHAGGAAR